MTVSVTWESVSRAANIAQLIGSGSDVLSVIDLIRKAANHARVHKSECRHFAEWLTIVENVVRPVMNEQWIKIQSNEMILQQLEVALREANDLVQSCGNRSYAYLVVTRCGVAERLHQSRAEIERILPLFHIAATHSLSALITGAQATTFSDQEAATQRFKKLLDEASKDITIHTKYKDWAKRWGNDNRFKDLDRKSRQLLLNERVNTLRKDLENRRVASRADFKDMLRERDDINLNSSFSRVKDSLRNDLRFKAVKKGVRTTLFNEYVAEMGATNQDIQSGATATNENEVEISAVVYMPKVLRRMVNSLQKILRRKPACTRDASQSAHDN